MSERKQDHAFEANNKRPAWRQLGLLLSLLGSWWAPSAALAADAVVHLRTVPDNAAGAPTGFRYTLEEDVTWAATPGSSGRVARDANGIPVRTPDVHAPDGYRSTLAVELHKSYFPVARTGHLNSGERLTGLDPYKRYYLSVIPDVPANVTCERATDNCYTMSGVQIEFRDTTGALYTSDNPAPAQVAEETVFVNINPQPLPTAQIYLRAFEDIAPINNVWDNGEPNIGGMAVFLYDAGGRLSADVYGNPLGTTYRMVDGVPQVLRRGDGTLHTMTQAEASDPLRNPDGLAVGEALIKHIAPGKYGVQLVPTEGQGWVQTATIEGTRGLDMWVKAGEPRYFAEFGPAAHHGEYGFVRHASFGATGTEALATLRANVGATTGYTISGQVVNKHMSRPPQYDFFPGQPLPGCWVGLNDSTGTKGLYAAPCDANSNFTVPGVPNGTYQLVFWDDNLLHIFEMQLVTVNGADVNVNAAALDPAAKGKIQQFGWFGTHHNHVFLDENGDGKRQANEAGISDQAVNLRYRDGSIYGGGVTDPNGFLGFTEVFPFFSWLVEEVDFARYKPTGLTVTVDAGGKIPTDAAAAPFTAEGRLNPQLQSAAEGDPDSGRLTRTEVGPVLTQGYNTFLGVTNVFEWGKQAYGPGENGGISGVVQYATTRAEDDPKNALGEGWEPGVPRVQVNLYQRQAALKSVANPSGIVDVNGIAGIQHADVDNYPFGWQDGGGKGGEDVDQNGNGRFDAGDAIAVTHTDSFDDAPPTGCRPHNDAAWAAKDKYYFPEDAANPDAGGRCFDGLRNYNQVRPALFDGGYAFNTYRARGASSGEAPLPLPAGDYVVEANAPRNAAGDAVYQHQSEESKNVDFGDTFTLNQLALAPACVGEDHVVPAELTLFPGVPARHAGESRPLCDRKQVLLVDGKNAGVNFHLFTEVPVGGHIQGFVLNDLANEFDPNSPNLGEKYAPSWIPVSVRDYAGNEVYHTYTDEFGNYNAIVPSTYRINVPSPSGVSPNMLQVCLNSPFMPDRDHPGQWIPDPYHNKQYTQFCYTMNFSPGTTTYLDTPVQPVSAFAGPHNWQLDCEQPQGSPVLSYVKDGPVIAAGRSTVELHSMGTLQVANPYARRLDGTNAELVARDLGFGATPGVVTVGGKALLGAALTWSADIITIDCSIDSTACTVGGQVVVTRGDNGKSSFGGITLTPAGAHAVRRVAAGQRIQDQIDAAAAGDFVVVGPGNYREMLVITKPITLQGWGAGVTLLNPVQSPSDVMARWRAKVNQLANCAQEFPLGLVPQQKNNVALAGGPCGHSPGTGLLAVNEGPGILIAPREGLFTATSTARVDGFTITGADQAAGILVNAYAHFVEISNNQVTNNTGPSASGIRVGDPSLLDVNNLPVDTDNDFVRIHHNRVLENGGTFEPGAGIGLYSGADNYEVTENFVCGNFALSNGGGITHYGLSHGGLIAGNTVAFNQTFDQTASAGGNGGGILLEGYTGPLAAGAGLGLAGGALVTTSPGTGAVTIERNTIIGNNAGSGEGAGIALRFVNGADVVANPAKPAAWHAVRIANNVITNNVAGGNGGGIALVDALNVSIASNTIANNDSSGSVGTAFRPHVAGVFAHQNVLVGAAPALSLGSLCPTGGSACLAAARVDKTWSNPTLFTDNIIVHNRAMHWNPASPGVVATLLTDGYWNLGVENGYRTLQPLRSLLGASSFAATADWGLSQAAASTAIACPAGADILAGNVCVDDAVATEMDTLFQVPYVNGDPAALFAQTVQTAGTMNQPEFANAGLTGAAATDEGGNFIDVHYGPLTLSANPNGATTVPAASYLLGGGAAAALAVNGGTPAASRPTLVDIQYQGRSGNNDIGADERDGLAVNHLPVLAAVTWNVVAGKPAVLQLNATDYEGSPLNYSLAILGGNLPLTGRPVISTTGRLSWNVPAYHAAGAADCLRTAGGGPVTCSGAMVAVSDGTGITLAPLAIRVYRDAGRPAPKAPGNVAYTVAQAPVVVVRPDFVIANGNPLLGALNVAAPGLLTGFAGGSGPLSLVLPPAAALAYVRPVATAQSPGSVTVGANGAFLFTPAADFAGRAAFSVNATDGNLASTTPLTVFLDRELGVSNARSVAGQWVLDGKGQLPVLPARWTGGQRKLTFYRDASAQDATARLLGSVIVNVDVNGGYLWSFSVASSETVPAFATGDSVSITAADVPSLASGGTPSAGTSTLANVPVIDGAANDVHSTARVSCPMDTDHDGAISASEELVGKAQGVVCKHFAAGDGFAKMADGRELYGFGFSDVTQVPSNQSIEDAMLNAQFPGPTMVFDEGDKVYMTLTNVGMLKRPDLFDAHSIHFHGHANAASAYDGVPESSFGINMGFSLTYFWNIQEPGTYLYHCHVEAAEHMQMGMLGNLYVRPKQNGTPFVFGGKEYRQFAYNDRDGSTGYDFEVPLQLSSWDSTFHSQHLAVQPLPFANMHDDYPLINGRGYPDTVTADVAAPQLKLDEPVAAAGRAESSQKMGSRIEAVAGQRFLLRITNVSVTQYFTVATTGLPMQVVGSGAHILRGPGGKDLYFGTQSVTLGGGESADVLVDTAGIEPGTYLLYSTNLNQLSNGTEDFGGLMTEIVVKPAN